MANRYVTPVSMETFEKLTKVVFAKVSFGSTGAPTLSATNSKGVLSVTRTGTGTYVFVFGVSANGANIKDTYVKVLGVEHVYNTVGSSAAPAAPGLYISADAVATANTCSITVVTNAAGTATDPGSGEIGYYTFTFGDSTAP